MKKPHLKKNQTLVMVTLMLMISTTLLANGTAATAQRQSAGRVAIELGVLLFFILSPLFIKRPMRHKTVK